MAAPKTLRLEDYRRPDFTTDKVDLNIDIQSDHTIVTSKVTYAKTPENEGATSIVLDAESPHKNGQEFIKSVIVDGVELSEGNGFTYDEENDRLVIPVDPDDDNFEIEIQTYLEPKNNTDLMGIYQSGDLLVSQCESEGFRRITPFLDRPDVMAVYTVRVEADEADVPVLLANGNKIDGGKLADGRHFATFNDPWPKPCYLFCTANGKLECITDTFTTKSGRDVELRVYTDIGETDRAPHAMESLKRSMKWDEDVFDCEYDLDNFIIVSSAQFNFGAMENKGLNVFRDSVVLANKDIATDNDHQFILDVVGHEYFHNYSGNRVTLANWFNISLKEGLTVLRERMFAAYTTSDGVGRINDVQDLRGKQFPEDDGPLVHAVMPSEAQSVENLYTGTIYEKGAEVLRMMGELMGKEKLIEGIKHYFKTYDGQAVTIDEFRTAMEDVSGLNLSGQFKLWYTQSGRPKVTAEGEYDPVNQTYTLTLEQTLPQTPDGQVKKPMYIPVRTALVDTNGDDMPLVLDSDTPSTEDTGATERVLHLTKGKQSFVFENVTSEPDFHSILRGFSAIVDYDPGLSEDQLYSQLVNDNDGFARWDASQKLAMAEMIRLYDEYTQTGTMPAVTPRYIDTIKEMISDTTADQALLAKSLEMPTIGELEQQVKPANPSAVKAVRSHLKKSIGKALYNEFKTVFDRTNDGQAYSFNYDAVGNRAMKKIALGYMAANSGAADITAAHDLYFAADNMTDQMTAMGIITDYMGTERQAVMDDFLGRFKDDVLVVQKYLSMQASSGRNDVLDVVTDLSNEGYFKWDNPGHVSSLFGGFADNYEQFHRADGKGYDLIADAIIKGNGINASSAGRLMEPLSGWRKYSEDHQRMMIGALDKVASHADELDDRVKDKLYKALPTKEERSALGLESNDGDDSRPIGPEHTPS